MSLLEWYRELAYSPVFPEELWSLIMNKLMDSGNVENLLNSIPNLSEKFKQIKICRYFGKVLPLLLKHPVFDGEKILKCRLVSKQWCTKIDHILETTTPLQCPFWDLSSSYPCTTDVDLENGIANRPAITLRSADEIRSLRKVITNHPGNPFVGRSVNFLINAKDHVDENADDPEHGYQIVAVEFIRTAHLFLRKFGHHIRYATLDFGSLYEDEDDPVLTWHTFRRVIQSITYLSNAHSIKLNLYLPDDSPCLDWFRAAVAKYLQPNKLPFLKSFQLFRTSEIPTDCFHSLILRLIKQDNLSSFGLPLNLWRSDSLYLIMLEEMKELVLDAESSVSYKNLYKILSIQECRNLEKLTLVPCRRRNIVLNLSDLFEMLHFANIKSLEIANYETNMKFSFSKIPEEEYLKVNSIEYLSVYDAPKMCYEFLYFLPCLKKFKISTRGGSELNRNKNDEASKQITTELKEYIYSDNIGNHISIWSILPSLNELAVIINKVCVKRFFKNFQNKCIVNKLNCG